MAPPIKNLKGKRFTMLVVERFKNKANGQINWFCRCDCGGTKVVSRSNLESKNTRSCGCMYKKEKVGKIGSLRKLVKVMKEVFPPVAKYADPVRVLDPAGERWAKRKRMAAAYRRAQGDSGIGMAEAIYVSRMSESWWSNER